MSSQTFIVSVASFVPVLAGTTPPPVGQSGTITSTIPTTSTSASASPSSGAVLPGAPVIMQAPEEKPVIVTLAPQTGFTFATRIGAQPGQNQGLAKIVGIPTADGLYDRVTLPLLPGTQFKRKAPGLKDIVWTLGVVGTLAQKAGAEITFRKGVMYQVNEGGAGGYEKTRGPQKAFLEAETEVEFPAGTTFHIGGEEETFTKATTVILC